MQYATYSPEDNKLRLYIGRVPRPEYEALKADGWTSTPKQESDFVATWTPDRKETALSYSDGEILDEDQRPEDRAADRAERFAGYREKRLSEACGQADRYEAGPSAYGYQSQARADRAAARFDRVGTKAMDSWDKADYWTRRTAGVIADALYKSTPAVRMGRIKEIEADLRKREKWIADFRAIYEKWQETAATENEALAYRKAELLAGSSYNPEKYTHPRTGKTSTLWDILREESGKLTGKEAATLWLARHQAPAEETEWTRHLKLRIAYEHQMLEEQGGRAAFVEMEPGGWIGSRQIQKVNKSNATGRTVSVTILAPTSSSYDRKGKAYGPENPRPLTLHVVNVERMAQDAYRAPTNEERAAFISAKKEARAAKPKADPCPLVNPTDDDAQRLQDAWNERAKERHCERNLRTYGKDYSEQFVPAVVTQITQATYSANSAGAYARAETRGLCRNMELEERASNMYCGDAKKRAEARGPAVCKVRRTRGTDHVSDSIIVLTDKPKKPFPAAVWSLPAPAAPAFALTA